MRCYLQLWCIWRVKLYYCVIMLVVMTICIVYMYM